MKRTGVEQAIAEHLLTDRVLEHMLQADEVTVHEDALTWRSWPQTFESTAGPWGGIGGAAMTDFQVTVAVDRSSKLLDAVEAAAGIRFADYVTRAES